MDNMEFEEEIQDKEYFEEKIFKLAKKVEALEEKIEEIQKILVNAYKKSVSQENQNDK